MLDQDVIPTFIEFKQSFDTRARHEVAAQIMDYAVYADNIIEYRKEHGGFDYIEEIKEVSGIGPATYEDIKDDITI